MNAQLAADRRNVYVRLSGFDAPLRDDLLRKIPLRKRRWDGSGRRWIIAIDQIDPLLEILRMHRVVSVWQR